MRVLIFFAIFFSSLSPIFGAETEVLRFSSKDYFFETKLTNSSLELVWDKSGFKNQVKKQMKTCWEKSIRKEVESLGKKLLSIRGKHSFGKEFSVSWKKWKDKRNLYPREIVNLDKRVAFIYSMAKNSESKCIK